VIVAARSESEWKTNQKAVLCALQTFDVYQKQRVDSVKYIQHKSLSAGLHADPDDNQSEPAKATTAAEVLGKVTRPFNGPLSGTTRVSWYQKGKTSVDFTEARDCEWQWNPLGHMQVCTSLQTDNDASTPQLSFLQAGCPFCRPTNSVKALNVLGKVKYMDIAVHALSSSSSTGSRLNTALTSK